MKPQTLALALLLAAAGAGAAHAAAHGLEDFIKEQDLDRNGTVTKEEFQTDRDRHFAVIDANKDGALSKAEYVGEFTTRLPAILAEEPEARREEQRLRELRQADVRFGVLDSDKDGKISSAEYAASGWSMFFHHDTNEDGAVSLADKKPDPKPGDKPAAN